MVFSIKLLTTKDDELSDGLHVAKIENNDYNLSHKSLEKKTDMLKYLWLKTRMIIIIMSRH